MRGRCVLVLLLILALSVALMSAPAGSATQAQVATPGEQTLGGPQLKDGGGGTPPGGNSGDDDRWGNARPDVIGTPDDPGNGPGVAPAVTTPTFPLRVQVRVLLGFVIVVITLR